MLALWCVSRTGGAWAQGISVPLGSAAGFGLLSGDSLKALPGMPVQVQGAIGGATIAGNISADGGTYRNTTSVWQLALTDLATARGWCNSQPAQSLTAPLSGDTLAPGVYAIAGNAVLLPHTALYLTGDSNTVYIFNIAGNLLVDTGAVVRAGSSNGPRVFWNVAGRVTIRSWAMIPGVVLADGPIQQEGVLSGPLALLSQAGVTCHAAYIIGSNFFLSSTALLARAQQPAADCPTTPIRQSGNLVDNGDLEIYPSHCPYPHSNIPRIGGGGANHTDLCHWTTPNFATPDYINSCTLPPGHTNWDTRGSIVVSHPAAIFSQLPRTSPNNGYVGIYAYSENRGYREYIQNKLVGRLIPGKTYYGEFWWSLADYCPYAVSTLGMLLSNETDVPTNSYLDDGNVKINRHFPQSMQVGDITATTLPVSNPKEGWHSTAGFFTATGAFDRVTIGNFTQDGRAHVNQNFFRIAPRSTDPDAANAINNAYYLIDDVAVVALPAAPTSGTLCYGEDIRLGSGLNYPAGFVVTYLWNEYAPGSTTPSSPTTFVPNQMGGDSRFDAQAIVRPTQLVTEYALTVTINGHSYTTPRGTIRLRALQPTLTMPTTVCAGQPVVFTVTNVDLANSSYQWFGPPGAPLPTGLNGSITLTTPGTYTYRLLINTLTPGNAQCAITLSQTVTVSNNSTLTVTGSTRQLCLGSTAYMSVSQNSGPYTWFCLADPSLNVSASTRSAIVQPTQIGSYTYVVTPPPGSCALPGSFTIQVNPLPTVAFSPRAVQYTCPNQWVAISLAQPVGGTVRWAESSDVTGPWVPRPETGSQLYPYPAVTTYYQATVTSAAGCVNQAVATVQVQPPVAITFPGAPYVLTSQQTTTLAADVAPAGLPGVGTWSATPTGLAFDPVTGDVDGAASTPGTYAVCYRFQHINGPSCPTQACTQVTVVPADCPTDQYAPDYPNGFPKLTGVIAGSQTFAGVYLISGEVYLKGGDFVTEPGTVFLMDGPQSRLIIDKNARFEGHSTTFTAYCDEMWDGIYVTSQSRGFSLGGKNDDFDSRLPAPEPWSRRRTASEISHSENGIIWDNPYKVPVRLVSTRMLHNLRGLTLNSEWLQPRPVAGNSAIVNCVFDADPLLFKAPLTGLGYYSFVHLDLDAYNTADVLPIYGNNFNHALVGVMNDNSRSSPRLPTLHTRLGTPNRGNEFRENLLAGYYAEKVEYDETVEVGYNRFGFNDPAIRQALPLPVREAFHQAYPGVLNDLDQQEAGVVVQYASQEQPVVVEGNNFDQPISRQLTSNSIPQIGIRLYNQVGAYQITANTFTDLDAGARLALNGNGANSSITSNKFTDCIRGLTLENLNPRQLAVVYPQCNTFERTDAGNGNYYTSYGIWFTGAFAFDDYDKYLDQATRNITPLKNYFTNVHPYPSTMVWLYGQTNPRYVVRMPVYATYKALSTDPALPANINTSINLENAFDRRTFGVHISGQAGDPMTGPDLVYDDNQSCQIFFDNETGIRLRRPASGSYSLNPIYSLGQNHPNPGADQTTIPYLLPAGTTATLIIRDLLQGRIVKRLSIRAEDSEVTFSIADLRVGIYTYTIEGANAAIATRRLLVNR